LLQQETAKWLLKLALVLYFPRLNTTLPTDITLDENTGVITIGTTASAQEETSYTIEATAGVGNYTGTQTTSVTITIPKKTITGYTLTYADTSVVYATEGSIPPTPILETTSPFPAGANVRYAIKTDTTAALPTGITLNENTGVITIETTASAQDETSYTIEATAGVGNYTGTKTTSVKITIPKKTIAGYTLTYADTSVVYATEGSIPPTPILETTSHRITRLVLC
jgi:UDP:flavonoid glycosyltransferase YjiC (YdhE family)